MAFSFSTSTPLFQSSQTLTLTPTPAQQHSSSFFTQNAQSQSQTHAQQQMYLFMPDRSPAGYSTKFEDLHSDSQKFLLRIEERITEYKDESQRLEQNSRLCGSTIPSDSFELDASRTLQELSGISATMDREKSIVQELMHKVKSLMWNTEVAVRSYMVLRPKFARANTSTNSDTVSASISLTGPGGSGLSSQPSSSSMAPQYDFYSGFPRRPSLFMQFSLSRFEKYLIECRQWVEELEQLLVLDSEKKSTNSGLSSLQSLPNIMSNVHDFFVHVAAKVESLHQYIVTLKTIYLANHRRHCDGNDPFLEADRRETIKQEAAAKRVHPTLHLPAISAHPSSHSAGLQVSTVIPLASTPLQMTMTPGPSGGSFSLFNTPSTSSFHSSSTTVPAASVFSSTGFSPQSSNFGAASTPLFGSSQPASLFGASIPSSATTVAIGSSSLFSAPSLTPATATASGASFGAASKSARPKSRTARR